jgi:ATP-dependent protease ClpP protease subunit
MAPVVPQSATALMKVIDKKLLQGVDHLHLMVSSPGGSVFHGLSIYNFLKGSPLKVTTYNFGTVDSIGVVIFCAGSTRISVPHARFLIHGVSMNMNGNFTFDEKALEEKLKLLKIDYLNIAKVIADTTGKKSKSIVDDMNSRTTLNPTEAKKYGLVHKIQSHLFPSAADLTVIHEDASIFELPAASVPQPIVPTSPAAQLPPSMPFTAPKVQGFTEASTLSHGTYFV